MPTKITQELAKALQQSSQAECVLRIKGSNEAVIFEVILTDFSFEVKPGSPYIGDPSVHSIWAHGTKKDKIFLTGIVTERVERPDPREATN